MNIRYSIVFSICSLLFALAVHAGDASPEQPAANTSGSTIIEIKNLQFVPAEITVARGTRISWVNLDPVDHDVTSGVSITGRKSRGLQQTKFPDGKFSSGLFGKDKSFSMTFDDMGEYSYYCNVHPFMTGKIIVR